MPRMLVLAVTIAGLCALAGSAGAYPRQSEISRGRQLAIAADCTACHTAEGGKPFAGGKPVETPFGTVYGKNITFDKDTGIGTWSEDDFWHALHDGKDDEGHHLYPAMPYNYYTRMPRRDVDAIYTYLKTLPAVHKQNKPNDLSWPFSWRWLMTFWDWLFFDKGVYQPQPQQTAAYNHGAYLVEGPGHCGACHTPTGFLGAPDRDEALRGNEVEHWYAPSLTEGSHQGLGSWTSQEIVHYLANGGNDRTAAFGPMAEVVADSTSKMSDQDLHDIAVYLKSRSAPKHQESDGGKPDRGPMSAGHRIYNAQCAACHTQGGGGQRGQFDSLKGSGIVQADGPQSVVHVILTGVQAVHTEHRPTAPAMPAFDWKLTDGQIADVATYIRNAWGNRASPVAAGNVADMRDAIGAKAGP
ncbi:MAG: c-type cytochrome [Alphaproteobacteria bacterium]|nr:c-type cytochrome [Alphaproteobacteria bacterium]